MAIIEFAMFRIGVFTMSKPVSAYVVESTSQVTTVTMAWITCQALFVRFALKTGYRAHPVRTQVSAIREGLKSGLSETTLDGGSS